MGAESVTGGVRDTLAAAAYWQDESTYDFIAADAVLDALSSPEVVRVATEALTAHTGYHFSGLTDGYVCNDCEAPLSSLDVDANGIAAHQWSVLVSALRGER